MIRDLGQIFDLQFKSRKHLIEFTLNGYSQAKNLYVVDDFCCWFPGAQPMKKDNGIWKFSIQLYEGDYYYAFMVDGYHWLIDPDNPKKARNLHGKECSLFRIDEEMLETKVTKMDGKILLKALYHDQTPRYLDIDQKYTHFKFRAKRGDLTDVSLIIKKEGRERRIKMEKTWEDKYFEYFKTTLKLKQLPLKYFFEVKDYNIFAYFSSSGASYEKDDVQEFILTESLLNIFNVPEWTKGAVFYQIFPERFCNGDKSNDPPNISEWGCKPTLNNFFGGDLQGIIQKLDYLQSLGVNAIYLTPIFRSDSNHKYDTYDYFSVDPHLGGNETLKTLVEEAHKRGIRIILDAVFHHTSNKFWAFEDILKNQEKSKYTGWYFVRKVPIKEPKMLKALMKFPLTRRFWFLFRSRLLPSYETFAGVPNMPKLNLLNPETAGYFMNVAEFWVREYDIDGWRFDVAFGIPFEFWRKLRIRLKQLKPDIFLLGEFGNGNTDPSAWVGPEVFDSVMNYPLRGLILDFVVFEKIDIEEFHQRLMMLLEKLPFKAIHSMYNLLGSHDTPRLLTICGGDVKKAKLAIFLQFVLPGAPAIYYGDEIGLQGGGDPDCRRTMPWDLKEWNIEILNYYKKLITIRESHEALRCGDLKSLILDKENNVYFFQRSYGTDVCFACVNNSREKVAVSVQTNDSFFDVFAERVYKPKRSKIVLVVGPKSGVLLFKSDAKC